ncbi:MAG TPA: MFS transporter [Polyangiaceae bacterium]|nr:MFS transporter [Polyangiaceae bacterium]
MRRAPRPWHFFFLILPYGASFGYVSVALPFLAKERGVPVDAIAAVIAMAYVPHVYKPLWAPVVDATFGRKTWYAIAAPLVAIGTFVSAAMPVGTGTLPALTAAVVTTQLGLSLLGMACEGLLGRGIPAARKGAASAWFQAGAFFGSGVGGGAALELATREGGPKTGLMLGAAFLACAFPLVLFDEPEDAQRTRVREALRTLARDLWGLLRSRSGLTALVLCLSPIGSGAAGNLFSAISDEWGASRATVALVTGVLGGAASAAGAAAAALVVDRLDRRLAYGLAGALTAATGLAMALAPRTPGAYVAFTLVYQAFNGLAFSAFAAFAFETIGGGAVVTKYNVLASLLNVSISYATRVDGRAHVRWGGGGVLVTDAAMTGAGLALLAAISAPRFLEWARLRRR